MAMTTPTLAQDNTCNANATINYVGGPVFPLPGDQKRVRITLAGGDSQGGTQVTINRVRFELDCSADFGLGIPCTDDGNVVAFDGNITDTCAGVVSQSTHTPPGDSTPNQVVFDLVPPLVIPENTPNFCFFEFDIRILSASNDVTSPNRIEEVAGFSSFTADAVCNTSDNLPAGNTSTGSIGLCPSCDDGQFCNGVETCNQTTGQCQPGSPVVCPNTDGDLCTSEACNEDLDRCVTGPRTVCGNIDGDLCTTETCNAGTGQCESGPRTVCGNIDGDLCTTETCNASTGQCESGPRTVCGNTDDDLCTTETCNAGTGQCESGPRTTCPDACQECKADTGSCALILPPPQGCGEAICRTPGFWGTHAGVEKGDRSQNITAAVIDCVDGNCLDHTVNDYLLICGEKIDSPDSDPADGTTDVDDAASSTEAICVPVKGAQILQLARQLTAAALNCLISGGGADCQGTSLYATVFKNCNDNCLTLTKEQKTACIAELDCLNNGNTFDGGVCTPGEPGNNCHDRLLVNEELGLTFEPPGAAGSSDACNAATDTKCTVVGPFEAQCDHDSLP